MKRILTMLLTVIIASIFININTGNAEKKKASKDSPCVTDCKAEYKKCVDAAKKSKKSERKAKFSECEKAEKDCKANCDKNSEPGSPK